MPLAHNVILESGIGPLVMRDTYILGFESVPPLPASYWLAVTLVSILGAGIFIVALGYSMIDLVTKFRLHLYSTKSEGPPSRRHRPW